MFYERKNLINDDRWSNLRALYELGLKDAILLCKLQDNR